MSCLKPHKMLWSIRHSLKALVPGAHIYTELFFFLLLCRVHITSPFNSFSKFYCKFTCLFRRLRRTGGFMRIFLTRSSLVFNCLWSIDTHHHSTRSWCFFFFTSRSTTSGATATYQREIWIRDSVLIFCMRTQQQMRSNRCRWVVVVTFFRSWRFVNKEIHFRSGSATSERRECLMMQPRRCYGSQDAEMPILI